MRNVVSIRRTVNGGWFAYNHTTKENTRHYIRKTRYGAVNHAKRLWGAGIKIVETTIAQRVWAETKELFHA